MAKANINYYIKTSWTKVQLVVYKFENDSYNINSIKLKNPEIQQKLAIQKKLK